MFILLNVRHSLLILATVALFACGCSQSPPGAIGTLASSASSSPVAQVAQNPSSPSSPAGQPAPQSASDPSSGVSPRPTYTAAPPVGNIAQYAKLQAVIKTERGTFAFRFFPKAAPHTVASFVKLARDGFYNGLTFHRVVPGFVVQGGDPTGTGSGGPGYTLPAEFNNHPHLRGTVAMARTSDPNSAGSQFYICLAPQPELDHQYTVFGQVTHGMSVVDKIQQGDHMLVVRIEPLK